MITAFLLLSGDAFSAARVYQKPSDFIKTSLGAVPKTEAIQLNSAQKKQVARLLGKYYKTSTIRFWRRGDKTAFILENIGKTEDITTGYVVQKGKIVSVKVLVYRESHGWEVARESFTRQFRGVTLNKNGTLSRRIKNIAGATLSVRSLTKMGRVALYLDTIK